jgi:hypothetical protein
MDINYVRELMEQVAGIRKGMKSIEKDLSQISFNIEKKLGRLVRAKSENIIASTDSLKEFAKIIRDNAHNLD